LENGGIAVQFPDKADFEDRSKRGQQQKCPEQDEQKDQQDCSKTHAAGTESEDEPASGVGPDHCKGTVCKVYDVHQPEDERQSACDHHVDACFGESIDQHVGQLNR